MDIIEVGGDVFYINITFISLYEWLCHLKRGPTNKLQDFYFFILFFDTNEKKCITE
jgi:hypothetical protein